MNKFMTKFFALFAALFMLNLSAQLQAQVSDSQAVQIKMAIKSLVDEYAVTRDNNDAAGYAATFAEDGTLDLYGTAYSRDALRERVEASDPSGVSMHLMSTGQINIVDETSATGVHYFTLYTGSRGDEQEEGSAVNVSSFTVMGKYHDDYILTDDGWKFANRRVEAIFRPAQ